MMQRTKIQKPIALTTASVFSEQLTLNAFVWFTLEVPDADKAKTVTIQTLSGITGAWEDVVDLTNVTTKYKGLTAEEMAIVGCLEIIRLKFSAAPAADSIAVFHLSS